MNNTTCTVCKRQMSLGLFEYKCNFCLEDQARTGLKPGHLGATLGKTGNGITTHFENCKWVGDSLDQAESKDIVITVNATVSPDPIIKISRTTLSTWPKLKPIPPTPANHYVHPALVGHGASYWDTLYQRMSCLLAKKYPGLVSLQFTIIYTSSNPGVLWAVDVGGRGYGILDSELPTINEVEFEP